MRRRENPILQQLNKTKFNLMWDKFMAMFYVIYMLLTFFSILFGIVYVLYFSYYKYNLHNMLLGITITVFMVYLNGRRPS